MPHGGRYRSLRHVREAAGKELEEDHSDRINIRCGRMHPARTHLGSQIRGHGGEHDRTGRLTGGIGLPDARQLEAGCPVLLHDHVMSAGIAMYVARVVDRLQAIQNPDDHGDRSCDRVRSELSNPFRQDGPP